MHIMNYFIVTPNAVLLKEDIMFTETFYTVYTVYTFDIHSTIYFSFLWRYTLRQTDNRQVCTQSIVNFTHSFPSWKFCKLVFQKQLYNPPPFNLLHRKSKKQHLMKYKRQECF